MNFDFVKAFVLPCDSEDREPILGAGVNPYMSRPNIIILPLLVVMGLGMACELT